MEEYVLAYTIDGVLKAETLCSLLQSFGIAAIHSQESAGLVYGLTVGPLGEAKIYVPVSQLQAAQEILSAWERGETTISEDEDLDDTQLD